MRKRATRRRRRSSIWPASQFDQAKARLEELRITTANTLIVSPVDGFVGKRSLDPGAWVTPNSPFISVVDIHIVRLVVNVVEKDLRRIAVGTVADVEVDAYPGEVFSGRVARIAPVLDPATRTAQIEVEMPNRRFPPEARHVRARTVHRGTAQAGARGADRGGRRRDGKRGVFRSENGKTATFHPVSTGLEERGLIEVTRASRRATASSRRAPPRCGTAIGLCWRGTESRSGRPGARGRAESPDSARRRRRRAARPERRSPPSLRRSSGR